jgi:hypothetical protein
MSSASMTAQAWMSYLQRCRPYMKNGLHPAVQVCKSMKPNSQFLLQSVSPALLVTPTFAVEYRLLLQRMFILIHCTTTAWQ